MGLLLHVLVHEAHIQDYRGGKLLLAPLQGKYPRLLKLWADSGYTKDHFAEWIQTQLGYRNFFVWVVIAAIPALVLSRFIPIRGGAEAPAVEPATAS